MQLKNVISDLQVAARAARLQGDETAALAIEQSLNELKIDWPNISHALVEISFSATATRHRELDIAKWSILNPKAIHTSGLVSIIDCEGEGRITMIGGSILIRGSIAMEPMTALLIADHAKRNHNGKGTAFGSPEFLNNIAIANCVRRERKFKFPALWQKIGQAFSNPHVVGSLWSPKFMRYGRPGLPERLQMAHLLQ